MRADSIQKHLGSITFIPLPGQALVPASGWEGRWMWHENGRESTHTYKYRYTVPTYECH